MPFPRARQGGSHAHHGADLEKGEFRRSCKLFPLGQLKANNVTYPISGAERTRPGRFAPAARNVGYSARRAAAGGVRAAISAGAAASRLPAASRATKPSTTGSTGTMLAGTNPTTPPKVAHAHRPA